MEKGQSSVEFLTIFGFIFLMTVPLVVIFFDQMGAIEDAISQSHLRNLAIKIADKSESVYYLGEPSRASIKAYFPKKIDSIEIIDREIRFNIMNSNGNISQIYAVSNVNMTGNLSRESGIHYIEIESADGYVVISG
jgi:hypothetical protein